VVLVGHPPPGEHIGRHFPYWLWCLPMLRAGLPREDPGRPATIIGQVTLTFRRAGLADVSALAALIETAYRGESSRAGWTTEADLLDGQRTDAQAIAQNLRTAGRLMLVAEADGFLAGCCLLERRPQQRAYFGMFSVPPGHQGQGWGGQLLAEAERLARDDWAAQTMVMSVLAPRLDLIAWYERRGYRRTGETQLFPYDDVRAGQPKRPDLHFVVLAKPLAAATP
jgi:ribosomal protein S18 acetylase RimI-like enzyme